MQPSVPASDTVEATTTAAPGASGSVRAWLRLEGLAVLVASAAVFAAGGHSWPLFALLLFVPDLSMLGYLAGPRVGAWAYNAAHSYVGPIVVAILMVATGRPPVIACIWAAHIGLDRMLGYGLKYPSGFAHTHLGPIGRGPRRG